MINSRNEHKFRPANSFSISLKLRFFCLKAVCEIFKARNRKLSKQNFSANKIQPINSFSVSTKTSFFSCLKAVCNKFKARNRKLSWQIFGVRFNLIKFVEYSTCFKFAERYCQSSNFVFPSKNSSLKVCEWLSADTNVEIFTSLSNFTSACSTSFKRTVSQRLFSNNLYSNCTVARLAHNGWRLGVRAGERKSSDGR